MLVKWFGSELFQVIEADTQAWPRTSLDNDRVAQFMDLYEEGGPSSLPAILVVPDGDNHYLLADGWHRMAAANWLGWTELLAQIVEDSDA